MDRRSLFDDNSRAKDDIGFQQAIGGQFRVMVQEHCFRRLHRHTIQHCLFARPGLPSCLDPGEFGSRVDTLQFVFGCLQCNGASAFGTGDFDNIGKIVFPLRVVVADTVQQFYCAPSGDRDDAAIAKCDRLLRLAGFTFLPNCQKLAILDNQAAIACRSIGFEPENHHLRAVLQFIAHRTQRLGAGQRGVAKKNENIIILPGKGFTCGKDGMCRSKPFCLFEHGYVFG